MLESIKIAEVKIEPPSHWLWTRSLSLFLLAVMVFLLPLVFVPSISISLAKTALIAFVVGAIFVFWILGTLRRGSFFMPFLSKNYLLIAAAILPVVAVISALLSRSPANSFMGQALDVGTGISVLIGVLLLFFTSRLLKTKEQIFALYVAFFASAFLIALFQLCRLAFGPSFLSFGIFTDPTSNLIGKWSEVGIFFGLTSVLSLATLETLALSKWSRIVIAVSLAVSLLFVFLVGLSYYYLPLFLAVFALGIGAYAFVKNIQVKNAQEKDVLEARAGSFKRSLPWASIITLAAALIFFGINLSGVNPLKNLPARFDPVSLEVSPSYSQTFNILGHTVRTSIKDAFFGIGPNLFEKQWELYRPSGVIAGGSWNVDFNYGIGLVPTFATTEGIVGLLSWIVFFLLFLWLGFRTLSQKNAQKQNLASSFLTLSSFLGAFYLWVFTVVSMPGSTIFFLAFIFTGIFLASLYENGSIAGREIAYGKNKAAGFLSALLLIVLLIAAISFLFIVGEKAAGAVDFNDGLNAANVSNDGTTAMADIRKAAGFDHQEVYYQALVQLDLMEINSLFSQQGLSQTALLAQFNPLWTMTQEDIRNALVADPTDYQNYLLGGTVYETLMSQGLPNAFADANAAYQSAFSLDPTNPLILLSLARLNAKNTSADKNALTTAEQYITAALTLKPNYADPLYLQAQIQVNQNNVAAAIQSLTAVVQLDPTDPTVFYQLGYLQYFTKNYSAAIQSLGQAVSIESDYSDALYFLGLSYYQEGNVSAAIDQFAAVQKFNPTNQAVADILANLRAGHAPISDETTATDKAAAAQHLNATPKSKISK